MKNEVKNEMCNYMNILCEMTNKNLDEMVENNYKYLPLIIVCNAQACYLVYDTQEEIITNVTLLVMNRGGLVIAVDPIGGVITGSVADQNCISINMKRETADALFACARAYWEKRLSTEMLISPNSDGRFIAADLLG